MCASERGRDSLTCSSVSKSEKDNRNRRRAVHPKLLFRSSLFPGDFGVILPSRSLAPSAVTTRHHNYSTSAAGVEGKLCHSPSPSSRIPLSNGSCGGPACILRMHLLSFFFSPVSDHDLLWDLDRRKKKKKQCFSFLLTRASKTAECQINTAPFLWSWLVSMEMHVSYYGLSGVISVIQADRSLS